MPILKPSDSIIASMAVAALAAGIWQYSLPSTAEMHATQAYDPNIEAARKKAAWTSAAVVSAVSLIAKDPNIFILGSVIVIAFDWHARHALITHPDTGQIVSYDTVKTGLQPVA
jgi:3D (Asp-Asp-Asp) domain-containing protein